MADDLTVNREGDTLVIRIPIQAPTPSASGKTLVVASTRGKRRKGPEPCKANSADQERCAEDRECCRGERVLPHPVQDFGSAYT